MKTHFGLERQVIKTLSSHLNKTLANTFSLAIQTLNCHWNLEGPGFFFLHEMLHKEYDTLIENGDALAERIRQMGEKVPASLTLFAKNQDLETISDNATPQEMLSKLASFHEKAIQDLREISSIAEEAKDFGLVDLLGGILRAHEKSAWIMRSHLS